MDLAWSSQQDIYLVSAKGHTKPRKLSLNNQGASTKPIFSPDGKYLSWFSMRVFIILIFRGQNMNLITMTSFYMI